MVNKERFKAYIAAYLVLEEDGQVLLSRRYNTGYNDGNYSLVSGHFEGGETSQQCIIREASEEASIKLNKDDLEVVHVMHRLAPDREYFDIYLRAKKWTGEIKIMETDKCDELSWYKLNNLPDNTVPEVKSALENIRHNLHYSEFGWPI